MATEYLELEDALFAYAEAVEISPRGAEDALLNRGHLESTLARPRNAGLYENADLIRQAATLFWGVTTNHAFRDGNKRTAVVILRTFLNLNGHDHSLTDDELFELTIGVAESGLDVEAVERRLRACVSPL